MATCKICNRVRYDLNSEDVCSTCYEKNPENKTEHVVDSNQKIADEKKSKPIITYGSIMFIIGLGVIIFRSPIACIFWTGSFGEPDNDTLTTVLIIGIILTVISTVMLIIGFKDRMPSGNVEIDKNDTIKCPYCAETIKAEASICRFCQKELTSKATDQT